MMERTDVLTPSIGGCPSFVVDTAVNYIEVAPAADSVNMVSSVSDTPFFVAGDKFTILSIGYFMPERFSAYGTSVAVGEMSPVPQIRLRCRTFPSGVDYDLSELGQTASIKLPFPNYELSVGVFAGDSTPLTEKFSIRSVFPYDNTGFDRLRVSMVDVAAALNGVTFYLVPFVKVQHNFQMVV